MTSYVALVEDLMEYRTLGRSGTAVSKFGLGTMTFGAESEQRVAFAILDEYLAAGGNFVDTADVYAGGESERIIGRWLADRQGVRDRIVLATKARFPMSDDPNDAGLSRVKLHRALDASLRRLGVDHIDLYQAHSWDPLTPLEETLGFFDDAVRAGKIRYAGVSNFAGWQLERAALIAEFRRLAPIVTVQPQYNLLAREVEWELAQVCRQENIGMLAWSPLAGGWLTGKYRRTAAAPAGSRMDDKPAEGAQLYDAIERSERTWRVLDEVGSIADELGVGWSRVALAWLVDRPAMTSVLLGARTLEQLTDNLGAADLRLSDEHTRRLTEVSEPAVGEYPYVGVMQRSRHLSA